MEKRKILVWVFQIIRMATTVFAFLGMLGLMPLSMFSIPFLCATAFDASRLSAGILIVYLLVFLLSILFLIVKKTNMLGIIGLTLLIIGDFCSFILSAIWGSNLYCLAGIPVCIIELLFLLKYLHDLFSQRRSRGSGVDGSAC